MTRHSYKGDSNEIVRNASSRKSFRPFPSFRRQESLTNSLSHLGTPYFPQISRNAYFQSRTLPPPDGSYRAQTELALETVLSISIYLLPRGGKRREEAGAMHAYTIRTLRVRGPAKYTRCVSVAARGVASSLPAPFQLPGASFEVNVIRPLSPSLSLVRARLSAPSHPLPPFLLFAVSFVTSLPLSVSLSPFLTLSFSSFVFVRDIRTCLGWANFETSIRSCALANTRGHRYRCNIEELM